VPACHPKVLPVAYSAKVLGRALSPLLVSMQIAAMNTPAASLPTPANTTDATTSTANVAAVAPLLLLLLLPILIPLLGWTASTAGASAAANVATPLLLVRSARLPSLQDSL
jgi:hypothetical protein